MKKMVSLLMLLTFIPSIALADTSKCDWTQIKNNGDGTYTYSKALYLCTGQLVLDNKTQATQITDLTKAIQLKDLALQNSDARVALWMNTSQQMEERIQKIDSLEKKNDFLYFGLGALAVIGAGFMTARLIGK